MMADRDALALAEARILEGMNGIAVAGFQIGHLLAEIQDLQLWRDKIGEDGDMPRNWKGYLAILSQELGDRGHRASIGTLERLVSIDRLFVRRLGLGGAELRTLGTANLDTIRSMVAWDDKKKTIREDDPVRMGEEETREYIRTILDDADDGRVFSEGIRQDANARLGRQPKRLEMQVRNRDGRYYLVALVLWDGDDAIRVAGGGEAMTLEQMKWLGKRANKVVVS